MLKSLRIAGLVVAVASVAACGGSDTEDTAATGAETATAEGGEAAAAEGGEAAAAEGGEAAVEEGGEAAAEEGGEAGTCEVPDGMEPMFTEVVAVDGNDAGCLPGEAVLAAMNGEDEEGQEAGEAGEAGTEEEDGLCEPVIDEAACSLSTPDTCEEFSVTASIEKDADGNSILTGTVTVFVGEGDTALECGYDFTADFVAAE